MKKINLIKIGCQYCKVKAVVVTWDSSRGIYLGKCNNNHMNVLSRTDLNTPIYKEQLKNEQT